MPRWLSITPSLLGTCLLTLAAAQAQQPAVERLRQELTTNGLAGTLKRQSDRSLVLVPRDPALPRVALPDPAGVAAGLGDRAAGLPIRARGRLIQDGRAAEVTELSVDLGDMPPVPTTLRASNKIERARTIVRDLQTRLTGFLRSDELTPARFREEGERAAADLVAGCTDATTTAGGARVRDTTEYLYYARTVLATRAKTAYGTVDAYDAWAYRRMFRNARATVALSFEAEPAHCSGVLVGSDLVLTAAHCLADTNGGLRPVSRLRAYFDHLTAEPGGRAADAFASSFAPVTALEAPPLNDALKAAILDSGFSETTLDYALLRVEGARVPASVESQPLCANLKTRRGYPLYVIGYPNGDPGQVFDDTQLYMPRALSKDDHRNLACTIAPSLAPLVDIGLLKTKEVPAVVEEFLRGYREEAALSPDEPFRLYHPRYGGMPAMGLDPDTVGGVSGGPVYDRKRHCVAGVFIGGARDKLSVPGPSWLVHELALPVQDVLRDLKDRQGRADLAAALALADN